MLSSVVGFWEIRFSLKRTTTWLTLELIWPSGVTCVKLEFPPVG